jgi:hypothetical protein
MNKEKRKPFGHGKWAFWASKRLLEASNTVSRLTLVLPPYY